MSTVQDDLRNYIETTLNDNTQGIIFKIFIYETKQNEDNSNYFQKENSLQLEEKSFIPGVLVDFDGDKVPIEGSQLIDYTIPLILRVNTDGNLTTIDDIYSTANLEGFKIAMQEFSTKLTGNSESIDGINYVFNTDVLTPIGGIDEETAYNYVQFGINIYANSGDAYFGNSFTYELAINGDTLESVTPFDRSTAKGFNLQTEQLTGAKVAKSIAEDNAWVSNLSFYYTNNKALGNIVKQVKTDTISQNQKYTLKSYFPDYDGTQLSDTKTVILESAGISEQLGKYVIINVIFRDADDIL